ncbi:MAG: type II toxin-antitoxin system HicA family toxin [Armatimonadetes bacterium]|nr:type II toxin-antitoxin system HicA family toxin [Armatimonadota bacterium]
MSLDDLIAAMRRNPKGVRFGELVRVIESCGYAQVRTSGSHCIFRPVSGSGSSLVVARPHGGRDYVSPAAVRDVLALVAASADDDEGEE